MLSSSPIMGRHRHHHHQYLTDGAASSNGGGSGAGNGIWGQLQGNCQDRDERRVSRCAIMDNWQNCNLHYVRFSPLPPAPKLLLSVRTIRSFRSVADRLQRILAVFKECDGRLSSICWPAGLPSSDRRTFPAVAFDLYYRPCLKTSIELR